MDVETSVDTLLVLHCRSCVYSCEHDKFIGHEVTSRTVTHTYLRKHQHMHSYAATPLSRNHTHMFVQAKG